MGQVWLAEDDRSARSVALKLIRPERVSSRSQAFFEREARAGERLSHPGLVRVFEHGESNGVAYIAMELVETARTLRNLLDEQILAPVLSEDAYRRTAELFLRIAEAMQAAHDEGVVHRDLKPQNVLLTQDGRPKIADFGLARIEDETAVSMTGDLAGTYAYMSPEQVAARRMGIDHRSDIFSLGVVLYEMLALRRPFDGDTSQQIVRQILVKDPPDPNTIRSRVPRALSVVCGKCLEKDPDRRYASMAALAEDLRRFLADEPVRAKPPSLLQRTRRWIVRHPTPSSLLALGAIALAVISVLLARLVRSNELLEGERGELAAANLQLKVERDEVSRQVAIAGAVNTFLNEDLLEAASPAERKGLDFTVREALDQAARAIEGRFPDQPLVEAAIRSTIGTTYFELGRFEDSLEHFEIAHSLRVETLGELDLETLTALEAVALAAHRSGREDAEALTRRVVELAVVNFGENDALTLSATVNLALVCQDHGQLEEAESHLKRALSGFSALFGARDDRTLTTKSNLGALYDARGKYVEGEALLREVLRVRRDVDPEHPRTLKSADKLANLLERTERASEAIELHRATLASRLATLGEGHVDTRASMNNLATALSRAGEFEEAGRIFEQLLATQILQLGPEDDRTVSTKNNLGLNHKRRGSYEDAERLYLEVVEILRRKHKASHPFTMSAINNLGSLYLKMDALERAEAYLIECYQLRSEHLRPGHPQAMQSLRKLAKMYADDGRPEEAAELYGEGAVVSAREDLEPPLHAGYYLRRQAASLLVAEQPVDAELVLREAYRDYVQRVGVEHEDTRAVASELAGLLEQQGRAEEAADWAARSQ